ncbi:MAG: tetratricopeptide repeat protein, partial [Mucilaginibacter sp.]|uniref:tetratricopeptide repeat protein n=1 Tax=Mucilaginibacter sp. TaxID=1882438 RepID=UPI0034E56DB2
MPKYVLIYFLLFSGNIGFSQNTIIKNNYNKAAIKLNDSAVNVVFKGARSKESLALAIRLLDSATTIEKRDPVLYSNKVKYLNYSGRFKEALKQNEILFKISKNLPTVIETRGLILYKLGDKVNAEKNFKIAHQLLEKQYFENPKVGVLENLAFSTYLIMGRDSANDLLNKEKYRYKDDRFKRQLNDFI